MLVKRGSLQFILTTLTSMQAEPILYSHKPLKKAEVAVCNHQAGCMMCLIQ